MQPVSPVIPGAKLPETVYAKDQPEYNSLPVFKQEDGTILSRWKLSWLERIRVLFCGNVYLWISTFNKPLQPVFMQVEKPIIKKDES